MIGCSYLFTEHTPTVTNNFLEYSNSMNTPVAKKNKNYYIWTIGCQMNEADSRRLGSELESRGYSSVEQPEEADIVVLNTCVVRQQAEDKIFGRLGSVKTIKEKRPNLTVGLMGCMVGVREAPRLQKKFPFVDVFMPPSDTKPMLEFLDSQEFVDEALDAEAEAIQERYAIQDAEHLLPAEQRSNTILANVPVVLGCSHACTFCIIPYRRGRERSRPMDEILDESKKLVDQGVKEIMFLGQIVDRYGHDFNDGTELADLLIKANDISGVERIRFLTSHPNYMSDKLLDAVANLDKVCPHMEVPVQAGNNEVLANMRRGYTVEQFKELIDRIRGKIPDCTINTDIIVGFCGETHDQFMDTYNLMEEIKFDKVHMAKYSVRPRTVAARRMEDDVPEGEKAKRWKMLDVLQRGIQEEKNKTFQDKQVEILVEAYQKGSWRGRTPDNRLVFFKDDRDWLGKIANIQVEHTSPFSLVGKLVE